MLKEIEKLSSRLPARIFKSKVGEAVKLLESALSEDDKASGGIYIIENTANQKFYIGCTKDLSKRRLAHFQHFSYPNNKGFINVNLRKDLEKYGKEVFAFHVIEEFDEWELKDFEYMKEVEDTYIYHSDHSLIYNVRTNIDKYYIHSSIP